MVTITVFLEMTIVFKYKLPVYKKFKLTKRVAV
jgi:hypothetical protein